MELLPRRRVELAGQSEGGVGTQAGNDEHEDDETPSERPHQNSLARSSPVVGCSYVVTYRPVAHPARSKPSERAIIFIDTSGAPRGLSSSGGSL